MKAIVICRDNIGDLILATPLITTLAEELHYQVDVLANSYNAAALEGNYNVSKVYIYSKLHHRLANESVMTLIIQRLKVIWSVRKERYDVIIIGKGQWDKRILQWIRLAKAKKVIALGDKKNPHITDLVTVPKDVTEHLVKRFHRLLSPLCINSLPGKLCLYANPIKVREMRTLYEIDRNPTIFALQISSRKILQRWQAAHFVSLAHRIAAAYSCKLILLWSPGVANNPRHPGDDANALLITSLCQDLPMVPIQTSTLEDLMAAVSLCDYFITSDGGAMHIAAGLGKPIVALFGNSDPEVWAPWKVTHEILQAENHDVGSLDVDTVFAAVQRLKQRTEAQPALDCIDTHRPTARII
ncbi:glycosyltransferase family 9 protein [Acerihabitans sp. TG2]|uniref:glycosyltransferase family 9 protein n=1 Tax=Acerihabitans sp. TG2 TaxID=3096008 RepID=UPI002B23556B|nr:glycosyltransferase family 9 protein [Acerihabitans sp. TG2]MEA9392051.1 glycosyltransferase family 9 protein [Acerihabitans sp. TG2]